MRLRVLVAYALPALATQFVYSSFTTVLPGIYAKYFGMSAAAIATALLVTRIFDAVSDPLIGYLSDRTVTSAGRRKPWMIAGMLVAAVAIWQVTQPDPAGNVVWHFTAWTLLFYLGWTMIEIPHNAWGVELDRGYQTRNLVFFLRTLLGIGGPLLFAAIPFLIDAPTTEMTPQVMSAVSLAFILVAPVCIGTAVVFVPSQHDSNPTQPDLVKSFSTLTSNRLLWRLLAVFLVGGLAAGINGTLQFIYLDTYLDIGEKLPHVLGAMMLAGLLGLPLWLLLLRYIDKPRAWSASLALASCWVAAPALLEPGPDVFLPMAVMAVGLALSSGAGAMEPFALLGDVVDDDEWKHGANRAGAYFSLFTFGVKVNAAIGGSIGFGLLAFFSYDPAMAPHSSSAVQGLKFTYALLPALLFACASVLVFFFPLNRKKHSVVVRALARRNASTA